jgi:hypothetical protein
LLVPQRYSPRYEQCDYDVYLLALARTLLSLLGLLTLLGLLGLLGLLTLLGLPGLLMSGSSHGSGRGLVRLLGELGDLLKLGSRVEFTCSSHVQNPGVVTRHVVLYNRRIN